MGVLQTIFPARKRKAILWSAAAIALVALALFLWFYQAADTFWNDQVTYILVLLAAVAAAVCGSLLALQFDKGEAPRRIWLTFSLGWWAWAAGELAGIVYSFFFYYTSYPEFTVMDACWVLGYFFFGISLYYQYRLIYAPKKQPGIVYYLPLATVILLVTAFLTRVVLQRGLGEGWSWFGVYLAVLYPVCDLAQGMAALWLSILFGRGRWGRPWWALIAFAVSDTLTSWFWIGGKEALTGKISEILSMAADTIYLAGYLLVALGLLSNYVLHRYAGTPQLPD
jgi:hypothetical protein